jgi:hypothetical protein
MNPVGTHHAVNIRSRTLRRNPGISTKNLTATTSQKPRKKAATPESSRTGILPVQFVFACTVLLRAVPMDQ